MIMDTATLVLPLISITADLQLRIYYHLSTSVTVYETGWGSAPHLIDSRDLSVCLPPLPVEGDKNTHEAQRLFTLWEK